MVTIAYDDCCEYRRTEVSVLSYWCHTVVTLLLHYRNAEVTPLVYCRYTVVTTVVSAAAQRYALSCHYPDSPLTLFWHHPHTIMTLLWHHFDTILTHFSHYSDTFLALFWHNSLPPQRGPINSPFIPILFHCTELRFSCPEMWMRFENALSCSSVALVVMGCFGPLVSFHNTKVAFTFWAATTQFGIKPHMLQCPFRAHTAHTHTRSHRLTRWSCTSDFLLSPQLLFIDIFVAICIHVLRSLQNRTTYCVHHITARTMKFCRSFCNHLNPYCSLNFQTTVTTCTLVWNICNIFVNLVWEFRFRCCTAVAGDVWIHEAHELLVAFPKVVPVRWWLWWSYIWL
jgi:hypothetical protein